MWTRSWKINTECELTIITTIGMMIPWSHYLNLPSIAIGFKSHTLHSLLFMKLKRHSKSYLRISIDGHKSLGLEVLINVQQLNILWRLGLEMLKKERNGSMNRKSDTDDTKMEKISIPTVKVNNNKLVFNQLCLFYCYFIAYQIS